MDGSCIASKRRLLAILASVSWLLIITIGVISAEAQAQPGSSTDPKNKESADAQVIECIAGGHKALERGDLKEAIRVFGFCAQRHPASPITRYWLGMVYFFGHETDKAIAEFKEVVRLEPENPLGMAMLGRLYSFDQSKLGLARELLERSLAIKPDMEDARFDLARVYAQQGDLEKSLKEFNTLFEGEARFALYHTELAKILNAAGNKKEAQKQLERSLAQHPDFEPAKKLMNEIKAGDAPSSGFEQ